MNIDEYVGFLKEAGKDMEMVRGANGVWSQKRTPFMRAKAFVSRHPVATAGAAGAALGLGAAMAMRKKDKPE